MGTNCTALDACSSFIALGSYDGSIYLYSRSQSLGWSSGVAFRSHAPIIMNGSVIRLSLNEIECNESGSKNVEMVVVTSDGSFGVYSILPGLKLQYKGTIIPPMNQMRLSVSHRSGQNGNEANEVPDLARIVFTDAHDLLLVLCHKIKNVPVGGILNGFIYNRELQAWMRISDSRFKYSKLFSSISTSYLSKGYLSNIDQVVHTISGVSEINRRALATDTSASEMYYVNEDDEHNLQSFSTRAHCEDRIACSIALRSKEDFEHWLRLYARILVADGDSDTLRLLTDMLLGRDQIQGDVSECWWMYPSVSILGLNRTEAIQKIIVPEMTKNRSLQRLTNEIVTDLSSM
jgi:protein HIRA/HIR1